MAVWRGLRTPALRGFASAGFIAGAVYLIWRQVSAVTPQDVLVALRATGVPAVLAACGLTAASYLCLSVTEWIALHALRRPLSFRQAVQVAAPAYALTNSVGFSAATGTAVRLQLYRPAGLDVRQSTAVAMVAGLAVTLSGLVAAGLAVVADAADFGQITPGGAWGAAALGILLLAPAVLWYLAFTPAAPRWLGGAHPAVPGSRLRTAGLAAGVGDWLFSCGALFVLLPQPDPANLPTFLVAYVAGCLLSAATGAPGGIGVFEAIVLTLTSMISRTHETAAALLLYRAIYSLGPLSLVGAYALIRRILAVRARRGAVAAGAGERR